MPAVHAQTVANGERASVSVDFLRSPIALASSGRPSANGVTSVAVVIEDSECCPLSMFGPDSHTLGTSLKAGRMGT